MQVRQRRAHANVTLRDYACACALVGQIFTVGELALGKLDWANLHMAKDRKPNLCV